MPEPLEQLIESLLYEGYALYPYTPGSTKNATPTPFGILYPPAYAGSLQSTFDHLELRCVLEAQPRAAVSCEVRFLLVGAARRKAEAHSLELERTSAAELASLSPAGARSHARVAEIDGRDGRVVVALGLRARELEAGVYELALRVENRTQCSPELGRSVALGRSLLSTHPILRVTGGRFRSPLECPWASVNTFPVLASAEDDALIGATIMLPDHPQLAPESRGGLFDSTEIEEALLLHVMALSDAEREEIAREDPVVSAMVARAARATPAEVVALHGRVTISEPGGSTARSPVSDTPPEEPVALVDPTLGEERSEVDGVIFRRGARVRIRPGPDADLHARMLDGRTATIERIMLDYDGKTHLGVTIDGDPGQELMRESGRLLFFFAPEVEVLG